MQVLLKGGSIAALGRSGFRLRDENHSVLKKMRSTSFKALSQFLKKSESLYVINEEEVLQLHGNSWVLKEYKKLAK